MHHTLPPLTQAHPSTVSVADATAFLQQLARPITRTEEVCLMDGLGRVLACDVVSPVSVPPHDNSAMDGYAFDGCALVAGQPLVLRVAGKVLAGSVWNGPVAPGECIKIMTGAVMPTTLNTVVPHELTHTHTEPSTQDGYITIAADAVRLGDHRRLKGEDLQEGRVALLKGELLTPAALGLAASLGLKSIPVFRRLRVAYFSTGDEILSVGQAPREGAVYDSNRYTVGGLLTTLGCEVMNLGVVPDQPVLLQAAFEQAAEQADAIITSGGVSAGEADHTRTLMKTLGDVVFWHIAIRPGRPMAVGRIRHNNHESASPEGALLLGLPGNPVAAMVTFLVFVRPVLWQMMGRTRAMPPLLRATSTEAIRKKPGRTEYQRGVVSVGVDGVLEVRTTGHQGSGVLNSMVQANGLIVLSHNQGGVAAGDLVDVMMFEGVF